MKNYTILSEYKRQYLEKYINQPEPVIADSIYGNNIEMDIYLPSGDKFIPFRAIFNNTEEIQLYCMDIDNYVYKTSFKESLRVKEVNLYNLLSAATNLITRHKAAVDFESEFSKLTREQFAEIECEYFNERIVNQYCTEDYNKEAIIDVYKLLKFAYCNYFGRKTWSCRVGSYGAKHVFETLLSKISNTTYVSTSEFSAAVAMFAYDHGLTDDVRITKDGPNWEMELPDFYSVLEYVRSR